MKALLIDAKQRRLSEVETDGTANSLRALIGDRHTQSSGPGTIALDGFAARGSVASLKSERCTCGRRFCPRCSSARIASDTDTRRLEDDTAPALTPA